MIRAKFRCMQVSRNWDNNETVDFRPVNRSSSKDPENQQFWEATPSGEAQLQFKNAKGGYEPGAYYYIDMEPNPEGQWKVSSTTQHKSGDGDVHLSRAWGSEDGLNYGFVKLGIKATQVVEMFGKPAEEVAWTVEFTYVEPNDGAYTPS